MRGKLGWALALLVIGCGTPEDTGNELGPGDAATEETADAGLSTPDADLEADIDAAVEVDAGGDGALALPNLGPCPSGWTTIVDADNGTYCEPFPSGAVFCGTGAGMQIPGDGDCRPVGAACPVDQWPANLPATGVIYVELGAGNPQQGTIARPYGSIAQALVAASDGDIIALAKGTYQEAVTVNKDVTLVGACATETILDGGHSGQFFQGNDCELIVNLDSAALRMENLTLKNSFALVGGQGGSSLELGGVVMERAVAPIYGSLGHLLVEDSKIRNEGYATSPSCGPATIALPQPGSPHLEAFEYTVVGGEVSGPLSCGTHDSPIANEPTLAVCKNHSFPAVDLDEFAASAPEATASIHRSQVEGSLRWFPTDLNSTLVIADSRMRQATISGPNRIERTVLPQTGANGINAFGDISVDQTVGRVFSNFGHANVSRHRGSFLFSCGDMGETSLIATDVLHVDPVAQTQFAFAGECSVTLERVVIDGARIGLTAEGGAQVQATDLVVRNVAGLGDAAEWEVLPIGVGAYEGGVLSIDRFAISTSGGAGVQLGPNATSVSLRNGTVDGHLVGANVQLGGFDLSLLQQNVIYEGNSVDIDAQELQLPPPIIEYQCADAIDNDGDGKTDCVDSDCEGGPACPAP